ncbi:FkbM family methyltransferase [Brasilonema sp. UFV-L1]|uniref:FkbM family methyltransferase n=1 Tax=Brasilonema sp. UFV-L1 TaxID=2234130 RepID=UPI00145EC99E|nr:FkbM family methyltransferase [Brasilonema sp. UFV-L1]NMG06553.1 FkbM family methyltransferase [Brasilonema sp. UFV-L1]
MNFFVNKLREFSINNLRPFIHKTGFDVVRFPPRKYNFLIKLLKNHNVDTVIDVGANLGQYATEIRTEGFDGRILSIEPIPEVFSSLQKARAKDSKWSGFNFALGSENGTTQINLTNFSDLSSILEPTEYARSVAPAFEIKEKIQIPLKTLDSFWEENKLDNSKVFLKLDCQGFEEQILEGAHESLKKVVGVQMELSLKALYKNQRLYNESIAFMKEKNFEIYHILPVFSDINTGRLLDMDGFFFKSQDA